TLIRSNTTTRRRKASCGSSLVTSNVLPEMQSLDSSRSAVLEPPRLRPLADFDGERKQELGQFLTPESIGTFMASLFEERPAEIRLLDAGAGGGALIASFVKQFS